MTLRRFDAVVIGGRLSAAITAALLAKRGVRGMLVDQGELASGDGRQLLDLVMSEQGSLSMELIHSELGMREALKAKVRPVTPLLQAILPDRRIDLCAGREPLIAELKRGFGQEASGFLALLERLERIEAEAGRFLASAGELPPAGFFRRRAVARGARKNGDIGGNVEESRVLEGLSDGLKDLALAPLPFLTHLDSKGPSDLSLVRFARPLGRFLRGISRLEGGRSLSDLFLDVAKRKGFEERHTTAEAIERDGKSLSLRLANSKDDRFTADVLVDCTADLSGLHVFSESRRDKALGEALKACRPKGALYTIAIEVDRAVIPPGMAEHVILLDRATDPEARPILLVSKPVPDAPSRIQLLATCPSAPARGQGEPNEKLDVQIRARIERLIPFLSDGAPSLRHAPAKGSRPSIAHPLYDPTLDPISGVCGVPMRTPYRNVFVAGPAVMPGLGIEGEYLSALQAADAAEQMQSGVKRPRTLKERAVGA